MDLGDDCKIGGSVPVTIGTEFLPRKAPLSSRIKVAALIAEVKMILYVSPGLLANYIRRDRMRNCPGFDARRLNRRLVCPVRASKYDLKPQVNVCNAAREDDKACYVIGRLLI